MKASRFYTMFACLLAISFMLSPAEALTPQEEEAQQQARDILDATGFKGGLIVHFGCGDGKLTVALHDSNSYYVHGLDTNDANVAAARAYIKLQGLYGDEVMVEQFDGDRLPYIENLVNLLVSEQPLPFDANEILRVLAPNGVAYINDGNDWTMTVKPRPAEIDEWTHHLYDASNNAVSHDTVVGPPERVQWIGSPKWSRHHDRMSSVSGYVSANGRNFYIIDEGSKASVQLPSRWRLYARDAFNGTILWSKPVGDWVTHMWPFKSGPTQPARRLVAIDDALYVTLGLDGTGLSKVDAATGNVLWTKPNTIMTEEFIYSDGVIFAMVKDDPNVTRWNDYRPKPVAAGAARDNVAAQFPWDEQNRIIAALDANDGSTIWEVNYPIAPMTLTADANCIYLHDGNSIVCLDRTNGSHNWTSAVIARQDPMPPRFGPTLVVQGDYIVFLGGNNARTITCLSAKTGTILWSEDNHPLSGHFSPYDLFMINGQAWTGATAGGGATGDFISWDPNTGASTVWPSDTDIYFMHQRCHRQKATEKWIIASRTGTEFIDTTTGHWIVNHWTRSGCVFGLVPANGFVNITPHNCACYFQSKTFGFSAMAPAHSDPLYPQPPAPANRVLQGPAYGELLGPNTGAEDWPTYRCDSFRTGYIKSIVPAGLKSEWEVQIGGNLTTLTVANGRIYVASIDTHTLYALDDANGQTLWTFMAGGRVDSPPTIYRGRVIFGSADGHVYCLRETDGALIWKFQAAPEELKMTSFEQVESVWPLHGSVLVVNDEVYCIAGRLMFLDGGLRFLRIDPNTGALIDEVVLDEKDPDTGQNLQVHVKRQTMPVALPDILSSDGEWVFMRKQRFDLQGNRYEIAPISSSHDVVASDQYGVGVHLFGNAGFLDDFYMHRTYWIWGRSWASGAGGYSKNGKYAPAGRVMAIGPDRVYGYGRNAEFYKWSIPLEYEIFCAEKYPASETIEYHWTNADIPILANSIVLADNILWVAGPPDVVDEVDAYDWWSMDPCDPGYDPNIPTKLSEQDAALNDQRGGVVRAVAVEDGNTLAEYNIESMPVWDGMVAANGRLYLSLKNGKVKCFIGTNYSPKVDAGEDQTIYPMATALLDANVVDDGMPLLDPCDPCSPPTGVTANWTKFDGPGQVTFDDPCALDTNASFSQWGRYTLRLTAFDGVASNYDDTSVFVCRPGDLDCDNDVDIFDIGLFAEQWLMEQCGEPNEWCSGADQTAGGSVALGDYAIMALNWLLGVEPAAPTNLVAVTGDSQVSLDWDDNTEADLAGYNVYRSTSRGYVQIASGVAVSDYVDNTVTNDTTYYYLVTAVDTSGYESEYSNNASATPSPLFIKLAKGIVTGVGSSWQTVTLPHSYNSMVVVATPNYDVSTPPAVVRIRNASGSSFEVRVDPAGGATPSGIDVYYIVVEEGAYTIAHHGVKMEAVKYLSTVTDNTNSWVGQAQTYSNSYSSPVVLGQVMSYNDSRFSAFWCCDGNRENPPSGTALNTGKMVGEDTVTTREDETIGYIVIEVDSGSIEGFNYVAGLGPDIVEGVDNSPPYVYSISGLSSASVAVATQAAMDGNNGSQAVLYGTNPVSAPAINLVVDEDVVGDTERSHTAEQVGYIVFE